jgi:hypothetical protein
MAYYPIDMVAQKWDISPHTVRDMILSGAIPEAVIDSDLVQDEFVETIAQSDENLVDLFMKHVKLFDPKMIQKQP